jgi:hypothetical protein
VHPRSFGIVTAQNGRVGTLSNQFGELLVAAPACPMPSLWRRVGHESSAMSHRYTHVGKEVLARAAETLPEI